MEMETKKPLQAVMQPGDLCLVTGVGGYLGSWLGTFLLREGYRVRGTVRSLRKTEQVAKVRDLLPGVELAEADLRREEGWNQAVEGVKWVFHVASPQAVKSETDRTGGALQGTEYLMQAALRSDSVRKIVLTSSEAAIAYGHPGSKTEFTEDDWTNADSNDYFRSKTLAEKRAWELIGSRQSNPRGIALSTINPSMILGPTLIPWARYSSGTLIDIAEGKTSMIPEMASHYVDVRDCARMHIAIMNNPATDGHRHFSFSAKGQTSDLANIVRANYAHLGFKASSRKLPKWLLWTMRPFSRDVSSIYSRVGKPAFYRTKHPHVYRYEYKDLEQMVKDTMESLLAHKLLAPPAVKR